MIEIRCSALLQGTYWHTFVHAKHGLKASLQQSSPLLQSGQSAPFQHTKIITPHHIAHTTTHEHVHNIILAHKCPSKGLQDAKVGNQSS